MTTFISVSIVVVSLIIGGVLLYLGIRRFKKKLSKKLIKSERSLTKDTSGMRGPCKMVLLLRTDLEMGKGKAAAQCCHATLAAYRAIMRDQKSQGYLKQWEREGETKIVLKVGGGEEEIRSLVAKARKSGLVAEYIKDAGHTQVAPGTITVAAVGPGPAALIDSVTGYLKLC